MKIDKFLENNKEVLQLVYGVFLIVIIPLLIWYNSVYIIKSYNKSIDISLNRQSLSVGKFILPYIQDNLSDVQNIQDQIESLVANNSDILEISVLEKKDNIFEVVSSNNYEEIGAEYDGYFYKFSYDQEESNGIATDSYSLPDENQSEGIRYWKVGMPIISNGERYGVVSIKISSQIIDDLTKENRNSSLYLLTGEIIIVILFLLLAVRFWDYALLYKKVKEVDQMKDEFISIASHELRTPVTGIKGYSSMMLDGSFGALNDQVRNGASMIQNASERLSGLVEDLLNVSRIEQGRMELKTEKVNVYSILKEIINELSIQSQMKKLELKFSPHDNTLPEIEIDKDKMKQVLINIIGNSIKYTEKGTVAVTTYIKDSKYLAISVKDTGIGMNEQERKRLFQKFYRVQNEKTQDIVGTGLGLWITKKIVEMMKGDILVDSIKGTGTEFTIIFPIIKNK